MYCDFSRGLKLVSAPNLIPRDAILDISQRNASGVSSVDINKIGIQSPKRPPERWRGSLLHLEVALFEFIYAGSWQERTPGEIRVQVDYSRLVTFYDPSLTSLVKARRGQPRTQHRVGNISSSDFTCVREELEGVLSRDTTMHIGSGIDWQSITHVIIKRYSGRLALLKYLLDPGSFTDVSRQAALVRQQLLIILSPYIVTHALPESDADPSKDTSWAAPTAMLCARTQTSHLPIEKLTRQEYRIFRAVEDTLHEICRVLVGMWVDAFDIETASEARTINAIQSWRQNVTHLMTWLDWTVWLDCDPPCGPEVCPISVRQIQRLDTHMPW